MKWLLIALIVIPGTIADLLNAMGVKRNGEAYDFRRLRASRWTVGVPKEKSECS